MRDNLKADSVLMNSKGKEIPVSKIRKDHLKKHLVVERIFHDMTGLEKKLAAAKRKMLKSIERYDKWLSKQHKVEAGFTNITLSNYPNTRRVMIKSGDVIEFDENLQIAKEYIDKCFAKWGKTADSNLKLLIDGFFKVGKKGFIDKASVLSLFQYEIREADWLTAMEYIRKAITVVDKRQYVILQEREDINGTWKTLDMNFSTLEVK